MTRDQTTSSPSTSPSLLVGLRNRDAAAWRMMAHLYTPLVYRWALRANLREQDAADVVQEVFSVVLTKIQDLRHGQPGDTFRGWLFGITRNKVREHIRRHTATAATGGSDALEWLHALPAEESLSDVAEDRSELLRRALELIENEFAPTTWKSFWSIAVEGRRADDVAQQQGISLNAVYLAKSRVARRLREVLVDEVD